MPRFVENAMQLLQVLLVKSLAPQAPCCLSLAGDDRRWTIVIKSGAPDLLSKRPFDTELRRARRNAARSRHHQVIVENTCLAMAG